MSADMFEDLRVFGLESTVAREVDPENALSVAIGKFKHPVEIMTIVPEKRLEQNMDIEVSYYIIHLYVVMSI